ncbi:MAG: T9SS type A sorting domain-containing protein [Chitinophagaceae bacterium]
MFKHLILLLFGALGSLLLNAQIPAIEWENTIGGTGTETIPKIKQTPDGGFIIGGASDSEVSGDKTGVNYGYPDYWVVKVDSNGNTQWDLTLGGSGNDFLTCLDNTTDGGFILGGWSKSGISGVKTSPNYGFGGDYWIIKLSGAGVIEWQKSIGGNSIDELYSIEQTLDGGYILGGTSSSDISGDKSENSDGYRDYWIVKLNSSGNIMWQHTYGGNQQDYLFDIEQTPDEGYIVGGQTYSSISGDKTENCYGGYDYWILRLNKFGNIIWQNNIGGLGDDQLRSIQPCPDGGFIVGGFSFSNIGGDKTEKSWKGPGYSTYDYWVIKLNAFGNIEWQNTIGGTNHDELSDVIATADNSYMVFGNSYSFNTGDKTIDTHGGADYWLIKLNYSGEILWQKVMGGIYSEFAGNIVQCNDSSYAIAGNSTSPISFEKTEDVIGFNDFWVVKLLPDECYASTEICNAIDDDCNGLIDDNVEHICEIISVGPTTFCQGGSVELTATYTGTNVQWKKDGIPIIGATFSNYTVTTKGTYSCETFSTCDTVQSNEIFVNVNKNPSAFISPDGPTIFCAGGSVLLSVTPVGGSTYQWYKGATPIAGATSLTYTATTSGNYKCRVTKAATGCYKNSNAIAVSVPCKLGLPAGEAGEMYNNQKTISFSPNPNYGIFLIEAQLGINNHELQQVIVEIYNNIGQLIYTTDARVIEGILKEELDINNLLPGLYFVKLCNNNVQSSINFFVY